MPVYFHKKDSNFLPRNRKILKTWIRRIVEQEKRCIEDINIIFTSDRDLLEINKQYLNHNYYTDIITFEYGDGIKVSGDIFISIDRIKDNAESYSTGTNEELKRVIIHGILHLCGYRDGLDAEKILMRKMEDKALEMVKDLLIV